MAAKHERERAVDEKLRQQEADRRQHAELLEQRRLQRERDDEERRRKDAEDDARVAREQREMLLKYEREQAAREPKIGVATAAQVVSSCSGCGRRRLPEVRRRRNCRSALLEWRRRRRRARTRRLRQSCRSGPPGCSRPRARAHKEETPVAQSCRLAPRRWRPPAAARARETPGRRRRPRPS